MAEVNVVSEAQPEYGGLLVEVGQAYGNCHVLAQPWPTLEATCYAQAVETEGRFLVSVPQLARGTWRVWVDLTSLGRAHRDWWKPVTIFPGAIARLVFV